jgi:hypothetical protein
VSLAGEQQAVRPPQRAHLVEPAALESLEQVLAQSRVTAKRPPVGLPDDRQACVPQRGQPLRRIALAERLRALCADLIEQRRRHEELAVRGIELPEDVRGQIAVQRIGFSAHAGDVAGRAPGLEQHAGHPAAGRLHGIRRVELGLAERGQRIRSLGVRESELLLAERRDRRVACSERIQRRRDRPAADEHEPRAARRIAQERLDHRPGLAAVAEALDLVENQDDRCFADRLGKQARRLRVRDPGAQRLSCHAAQLRQRTGQGRFQVRDEPARRGIRAIERQPSDGPLPQPPQRPGDSRRLAGAGGRRHEHDAMALDQRGERTLQPRPINAPLRERRNRKLASDDRPIGWPSHCGRGPHAVSSRARAHRHEVAAPSISDGLRRERFGRVHAVTGHWSPDGWIGARP